MPAGEMAKGPSSRSFLVLALPVVPFALVAVVGTAFGVTA
tara:strand:- start:312 stop:431 length:120 start_codon:yes stop_codon:yes gene_type:complete